MSTDIASPNGLMSITKVQTALCDIDDCSKRIRKGSTLCAGHYRLAQDDESETRFAAYVDAWNHAFAKATKKAGGVAPGTADDIEPSFYVLRTSKATSGFAYFLANHSGLEVFEPQAYGKARTFGLQAPSEVFAKAFVKALTKSDRAVLESVTFDALKVV